jgi:hypothetical protein
LADCRQQTRVGRRRIGIDGSQQGGQSIFIWFPQFAVVIVTHDR